MRANYVYLFLCLVMGSHCLQILYFILFFPPRCCIFRAVAIGLLVNVYCLRFCIYIGC